MGEALGIARGTMSRRKWLRHAPLPVINPTIGAAGMAPVQPGAQGAAHAGPRSRWGRERMT
jgi:hypothetical protein